MEKAMARPGPTSGQTVGQAQGGVAALALAMLLSAFGVSMANVALPTLSTTFAVPFSTVQWVVVAYLLASTTLIVGAGRLGDMVGHQRLLVGGILLFALASALCGLAPTLGTLVAARAVQGAGGAAMMASAMALVQTVATGERMGRTMGLLGTMSAVGTALGPSVGGILLSAAGWRALFLLAVPLGLITLIVAIRALPRTGRAAAAPAPFDFGGLLLLATSLAAYALAMTSGSRFRAGGMGLLAATALITMAIFVRHQGRVPAPLVRPDLLRTPRLAASLTTNALVSSVMMATLVVGPFFLSRVLGLTPALVGVVLAAGPVISMLSGLPAGKAVDRLGTGAGVKAGLILVAAGAFALALLPAIFGLGGYVVALAVLTPGYQLFLAANNTAVMAVVPADRRGVTSGLLSLSRNLGLITGASLMGALFVAATGTDTVNAAAPEAVAYGQAITFRLCGFLALAALFLSIGSGGTGQRPASPPAPQAK